MFIFNRLLRNKVWEVMGPESMWDPEAERNGEDQNHLKNHKNKQRTRKRHRNQYRHRVRRGKRWLFVF